MASIFRHTVMDEFQMHQSCLSAGEFKSTLHVLAMCHYALQQSLQIMRQT